MSKLLIKEKADTPNISIDNKSGEYTFSGKSFPEDAISFYTPIKRWVKDYINNPADKTIITLNFDYLNTASTKCLLEVIMTFEPIIKKGDELEIIWYYRKEDEDMHFIGKKFKALTNLPFVIKSY